MVINKVNNFSIYDVNRYVSSKEMKQQQDKKLLYENLEGIQKEMFGFDEFFRDDELYNPVTDYGEDTFGRIVYEPDDIPFYTPNEMETIDLNRYNTDLRLILSKQICRNMLYSEEPVRSFIWKTFFYRDIPVQIWKI